MATDSLGTLTVDLIANTGGFERGMNQAERTIKGQQKALENLRKEFDPTLAAYDRLEKKQEQLNRLFNSGKGVVDEEEFKNLSRAIEEARQSLDSGSGSLNKYGMSAKQMQAALRGVPAQFTDIATSLAAGQNPLQVFLQQGGQLKDMFGGAGPAARALGGYVLGLVNPFTVAAAAVGTLTLAYYQGSKESDEYNKAIILTGNAAGTTSSQLGSMAQNVSKSTGTVGAAAEVLAGLANSGKIASDNFEAIATAALKMQDQAGVAISDTIKQFERLAQDPVKASKDLNEQLNYLTAAQYEQIQALVDQGDQLSAASLAEQTYASALSDRADDIQKNLGLVETAWDGVAKAAKKAWDSVLDIGREDTLEQKLDALRNRLNTMSGTGGLGGGLLSGFEAAQGSRSEIQADIARTLQQAQDETESAWRKFMNNELQKKAITGLEDLNKEAENAQSQAEKLMDRMERLDAIRKDNIQAGSWTDLEEQKYQKSYESLQQQYGEATEPKSTRTPKTPAYREDAGTKMLDNLRQQYASMQLQLDTGEKLGTQAQALAKWEEELAQIKSKKTLTAEQQQLLASSDLITAQLKRNAGLEQELKLRQENLKVLAYQDSLNSKLQSQQQGYDMQLAGLGAGDKQRQRIQEQLRIEQDYQNQRSRLTAQATLGEGNGGISQSQYEKELSALNDYHDKALSSQLSYFEQLDEAQSNWLNGASDAWNNYLDQANNISGQTKDIVSASFNGMNDALYSFVTTGKLSFHDLKATFAETVLRMAIQWGTAQVAMAALNAFTSTAAIPIVGPLAAPAAAASALGSAGSFMSIISSVAGMAHDGIDAVPETGTWLLQKGERVVTSQTSAKLDKTLDEVQSNGGSSAPIVNIIENPEKAGSVERRTENGKQVIDVVVADLLGDGRTSKAFAQAFGMKRRGV